jgi:hypothetical protein
VPAVLAVALVSLTLAVAAPGASIAGTPGPRLLPNIAATPGYQLDVTTINGKRALRFSVATPNLGLGPLEMRPKKTDCNGDGDFENDRRAFQRFYHDLNGNGIFDRGTDKVEGDSVEAGCFIWHDAPGHNHWHFQDYARYSLRRIKGGATGRVVAERNKVGFCMLDSGPVDLGLPGAPADPFYGGGRCSQDMPQGISVGWRDVYPYNLADQSIIVQTLADGRYCLRVRLDPGDTAFPPPQGRILETDEADNIASTKLKLVGSDVTELAGTC